MPKDNYKEALEEQLSILRGAQKSSSNPVRFTAQITEILKMLTYGDYD